MIRPAPSTTTGPSSSAFPATIGQPDTRDGAVGAAIQLDLAIYNAFLDESSLTSVLTPNTTPSLTARVIAEADSNFKRGTTALTGHQHSSVPAALAYKMTGYTQARAGVSVWSMVSVTIDGQTSQQWTTTLIVIDWSGAWSLAELTQISDGPKPADLGGASVPSGYTTVQTVP